MVNQVSVFISYSTADTKIAESIYNSLIDKGYAVWFAPESLKDKVGINYPEEIIKGIKKADIFLIIVSKNSINSEEVKSELDQAFHCPKYILPVRIDEYPFNGVFSYFIGSRNRIEAINRFSEEHLSRIINSIRDFQKNPLSPNMINLLIDDYLGRGDGLIDGEDGLTKYSSYINIPGIGLTHVSSCYVLPTIINDDNENRISGRFALRTIIESKEPIIIEAGAGFGKSCFSKQLVLETINRNKEYLGTPNEVIPFLVELGHEFGGINNENSIETVLLNNLNKFIESYSDRQGNLVNASKEDLHKLLNNNKSILIFDGLDEISDEKIVNDIFYELNFSKLFKNSTFVFTSRPGINAENYVINGQKLNIFRIDDFDSLQREEFIRKWSKLRNLSSNEIKYFDKAISVIPERIKSNPLLLASLLSIYSTSKKLPKTMVEIYDKSVSLILKSTCNKYANNSFNEELLHGVLCELAQKHIKRMDVHIEQEDVKASIQTFLGKRYDLTQSQLAIGANHLIEIIRNTSLYHDGSFKHKTLEEYFFVESIFQKFFKFGEIIEQKEEELYEFVASNISNPYTNMVFEMILERLDTFDDSIIPFAKMLINCENVDINWLENIFSRLHNNSTIALKELYKHFIKNVINGQCNLYQDFFYYFSKSKNISALCGAVKEYNNKCKHDVVEQKKLFSILRDLLVIVCNIDYLDKLPGITANKILDNYEKYFENENTFDSRIVLNELFYRSGKNKNALYDKVSQFIDEKDYSCFPSAFSLKNYFDLKCESKKNCLYSDPCNFRLEESVLNKTNHDKIRGYVIVNSTKIQSHEFYNNEQITCVELVDTEEIGCFAFARCKNLSTFLVGDKLKRIGDNCFGWNNSLENIDIGDNVEELGECVFVSSGLKCFSFPKNIKIIPRGTFYDCKKLESISFEGNIERIGYRAFSWCCALADIDIDNVNVIEDSAFSSCSSLKQISISHNTNYIGTNAFASCYGLISITYNALCDIPDNFAIDCNNLKNITIISNIKSIGDNAFYKCIFLSNIILPDSLELIGEEAFRKNSQLKTICLPKNVKEILNRAFCDCTSLENIECSCDDFYTGVDCFFNTPYNKKQKS